MPDTVKRGTILIKEGTLLPEVLRFESALCAPGWRLVKNLDGYGLGRKIHEAGWTFSWRPGEIGATLFGLDEQMTLRRAVEQILANLELAEFNSFRAKDIPLRDHARIGCRLNRNIGLARVNDCARGK
jgi:hypothetical protein